MKKLYLNKEKFMEQLAIKGTNQTKFGESIKVGSGWMSEIVNGKRNVSDTLATRILRKFPDLKKIDSLFDLREENEKPLSKATQESIARGIAQINKGQIINPKWIKKPTFWQKLKHIFLGNQ